MEYKSQYFIRLLPPITILLAATILLPIFLVQAGSTPQTYYVDASAATGGDDGSSWADAFLDLQDALKLAVSGDEIWVAEGTYLPGTARSDTFTVTSGISIYGGFPIGGGDGTLTASDPWEHITILSGNIGGTGSKDDNVYHVVTAIGAGSDTLLDGFVIFQGYTAAGDPDPNPGVGAGMLLISSSLTIQNTTFLNNSSASGAGLMVNNSTPWLENVLFLGNVAAGDGGGVMVQDGSIVDIVNGTFVGNTAATGAGLLLMDTSNARMVNTSLSQNVAATSGGGVQLQDSSDAEVQNCIFWGNSAPTGPQIDRDGSSTAKVDYSLVEGSNGSGTSWDASLGVDGGGNLDKDPIFVRPPDAGYLDKWGNEDDDFGDLRLNTGSPAVDQGADKLSSITSTDQPGNPRIYDHPVIEDSGEGSVDMGAYEAPPPHFYVDSKATGTGGGTTWGNAFTTLQPALKWSRSGPSEIWVAEGEYTPGPERSDYFQLRSAVQLYGGFPSGGGDGTFGARDWTSNPTTLSGDIGIAGDYTDNSHNILFCNASDDTAILDGVHIAGANAEGHHYNLNYQMKHFYDFGGGLNTVFCDLSVTDVILEDNLAAIDGGGSVNFGGSPTFHGVTFKNNAARYGGGMYNNGSPAIIDSVFEANHASRGAGFSDAGGSPQLEAVLFFSNTAVFDGGGLYGFSTGDITIIDSTFLRNAAGEDGGGVAIDQSAVQMLQVAFQGNVADQSGTGIGNVGGGIYCYQCNLLLIDALFSGNVAYNGGGLFIAPTADVVILDSTFTGNMAEDLGGGIICNFDTELKNSIVWGNNARIYPEVSVSSTSLTTSYSLIKGGCPSGATCLNIRESDPRFIREPDPGSDGAWGTEDDDYGDLHLQPGSPAIDAGNNNDLPPDTHDLDGDTNDTETIPYDLDSNPRKVDEICVPDTGNGAPPFVDMGAYEVQTSTCLLYLPLIISE